MPLFWLSLAFLAGILLAAKLSLPMLAWGVVATGCMLLVIPRVYRTWASLLPASIPPFNQRLKIPGSYIYPLFLLFMTLGAVRYQYFQPIVNPTFIDYYNDQPGETILEGVLVSPPDRRDTYANLRVHIDQVRPPGEKTFTPVRGNILAIVHADTQLRYGDRIRLKGVLETPPENEDFSYREYLAHQAIYSYSSFPEVSLIGHDQANPLLSDLYAIRDRLQDVVHTIYPDPEASLVAGIILGEQSGITESVQEAFRVTGTSHIIVISG